MKIVHLACVAPPEIGGIGRVAEREVAGLCARGLQASLCSPTTHRSVVRIGNAALLDWRLIGHDLMIADIVHLHYPFYGTAENIAWLRYSGRIKRLVMTLHMDATADGMKGCLFNLHRKFAQPRLLRAADALLVSSHDYALHSSFAPFADQCVELPFGVDEQKFSPRKQHEIGSDTAFFQLLFVGGMDRAHSFKGVDILLRAMTELPQRVKLILVGDGNLRSLYERRARNLGLGDRVIFRGRVSDDELSEVYRGAMVVVLPSTSSAEAFGLVALEAQACGVPVVASDLPGVRTVVVDMETGLLVPPNNAHALADAIAKLLRDPAAVLNMGARARERVLEQFTWRRHIDRLCDMYDRICALPF